MLFRHVSLQYLAKKLGFDTLWFGYLQTTVGVIQLIGGPMFGRYVSVLLILHRLLLSNKVKTQSFCIKKNGMTVGFCVVGRFGDLFGARAALSLACGANIVFFLLLAIANHPVMLFIHKLPTIFMHVLPGEYYLMYFVPQL